MQYTLKLTEAQIKIGKDAFGSFFGEAQCDAGGVDVLTLDSDDGRSVNFDFDEIAADITRIEQDGPLKIFNWLALHPRTLFALCLIRMFDASLSEKMQEEESANAPSARDPGPSQAQRL